MTDVLPASRPAGLTAAGLTPAGLTPAARRGIAVGAAAVAVAVLFVCLQGGDPVPRLRVRPVGPADISVVNPATVSIAVQVTNVGAGAVLPTCILQAQDPTGWHHGSGMFAVKDPIEPGRTTSFTARLQVSGLGAQSVTQATAVCR